MQKQNKLRHSLAREGIADEQKQTPPLAGEVEVSQSDGGECCIKVGELP